MTSSQRLDSVVDITMGQAPQGESYNTVGEGMPLIAGAGDFGEAHPAAKKFTTSPGKICQSGDIVLGIRATIGEKVVADRSYCLGRGVAGLRPRTGLDPRYLWHWLTHATPILAARAKGATFKQVNREDIGQLSVDVLPLPEQRRIAAILDKANALRAKRRTALAQLDTLTQSIFLDMFGDPTTNPRSWPVLSVGEVAEAQGGLQVTSARKCLPREVPYLRVANVYRGSLDLREIKRIRATDDEIARTLLKKDDLLIVEGHGNPEEIGRAALWDGSIPECVHQNHLIRVRFPSARVVPVYACEYLNSAGGRRHLLRAGKTTSGLNTISVSEVRAAPIAVPPIGEQREFARRVAKLREAMATQRMSLVEMDSLFATLQYKAFRGAL